MSYSDFQAALAFMITRPDVARAVKGGDEAALQDFALTERERERLRGLVAQRGMAFYCSLARAHRLEAIAEAFPMTLVILEPVLRELLDLLWEQHPPSGHRFDREIALFAAAIEDALAAGALPLRYLPEVFRYERTCWALVQSVREQTDTAAVSARVEFDHPPDRLLSPLSRLEPPPPDLPSGTFPMEIRLEAGRFTVREVTEAPSATT